MRKQEAADFLGISTRTLERFVAEGKLVQGRAKSKTRPVAVFDRGQLEKLKAQLVASGKDEVFGRPNTLKPKGSVGFRLDPFYMERLVKEGEAHGMSAGDYARRLVVRGLEMGDELTALRKSLSHMFYLVLVTKMGATEAEAEELVRKIEGGS